MRIILFIIGILFTLFTQSPAQQETVEQAINKLSIDKAVNDICEVDKQSCKILRDKNIYSYLKRYYKTGLYTIAYVESKFVYTQGIYDKDDVSFFQINKRIWTIRKLWNIGVYYTYDEIMHDVDKSSETALKIWLVNIARYVRIYKKHPRSLAEYISLYHRIDKIDKYYTKKVRKVVYTFLNKNRRGD